MSFVCLAYHRISADPAARADPFTVRPDHFQAQMAWLARRGYRILSLGQALAQAHGQSPNAPERGWRHIALTFDDGALDFESQAWPVLQRLGFGATLFVVAGRAGGQADWPGGRQAQLLSWGQIQALAQAGLEIGAHGLDHQPLDELPPAELGQSLARMQTLFAEKLGHAPQGMAYPYGRWSAMIEAAAAGAGLGYAATARGGLNRAATPRYKLRRTLITGKDWGPLGRLRFVLKVRSGYAQLTDWRMDLRRVP